MRAFSFHDLLLGETSVFGLITVVERPDLALALVLDYIRAS